MRYVIDTHIFLWLLFDTKRVPAKILDVLKESSNEVYITSISFWEISLKYNLGKLELNGITPEELPQMVTDMGIEMLQIAPSEMASFYQLPKIEKHKDPFDRIIIWHCIVHKDILVSLDGKFSEYEVYGLQVLK
ncbi:MAG TPA: type II toxin-antitoxin system VapC family toxin [Bacteroidetes bacterium]|nr:type II toxin-antitoxin system VapC family toxin [Bacteroidota bacterium]